MRDINIGNLTIILDNSIYDGNNSQEFAKLVTKRIQFRKWFLIAIVIAIIIALWIIGVFLGHNLPYNALCVVITLKLFTVLFGDPFDPWSEYTRAKGLFRIDPNNLYDYNKYFLSFHDNIGLSALLLRQKERIHGIDEERGKYCIIFENDDGDYVRWRCQIDEIKFVSGNKAVLDLKTNMAQIGRDFDELKVIVPREEEENRT